MKSFLYYTHKEPIIVWSSAIGLVGLTLPVVVPPLRELMFPPTPIPPPASPTQVALAMQGKPY